MDIFQKIFKDEKKMEEINFYLDDLLHDERKENKKYLEIIKNILDGKTKF